MRTEMKNKAGDILSIDLKYSIKNKITLKLYGI